MQDARAVGFLDLAGYTALTDVHGDDAAADVVERFCAVVRASLTDQDVLAKSIGDAVLVHSTGPDALAALAARVCTRLDAEPAFPVLRVGLHAGPVVLRGGDLFGGTVNLAARIAAQARGAQVLATAEFADGLTEGRWTATALGALELKGLPDPVDVVELVLCAHPQERPVDPVCGMAVARASVAATIVLEGVEVVFCSRECLRRWAAALR